MQQLPIPNWKWGVISLDFLTNLPKNQKHNNSIMVVVDKLSKATHFIHVKTTYTSPNIADIFMKKIFHLHGIPKVIISNRDTKFVNIFWKTLCKKLDT